MCKDVNIGMVDKSSMIFDVVFVDDMTEWNHIIPVNIYLYTCTHASYWIIVSANILLSSPTTIFGFNFSCVSDKLSEYDIQQDSDEDLVCFEFSENRCVVDLEANGSFTSFKFLI